MKPLSYWLWLASVEGGSLGRETDVDLWPDSPADTLELLKRRGLSQTRLDRLAQGMRDSIGSRMEEECDRAGVQVLTPDGPDYPSCLFDLAEVPFVLFVRGALPPDRAVGVVGTRRCSPYGGWAAYELGLRLGRAGLGVISGGAAGIDSRAHSGALDGGGRTWAVLGTGLDRVWPPDHAELFDRLVRGGGGLISEYPLGVPGRPWRFPRRNRLIAALSGAVVVVESAEKGGALITADRAAELGRDVWAVPGRIDEGVCRGSNRLLEEGAYALTDLDRFVATLTGKAPQQLALPLDELTGDEQAVLKALDERSEQTADSLSLITGLGSGITAVLTGLELQGLICNAGGGRWRKGH